MFELLLLTDVSDAESVARDDLCRRIRKRASSVSEAIQVTLDDAALILRAVHSIERRRIPPLPLVELCFYARRLLDLP